MSSFSWMGNSAPNLQNLPRRKSTDDTMQDMHMEVARTIASRAGVPRKSARGYVVWFSGKDHMLPPTLQHYNPRTLKRTGRKKDFGRSQRRIAVGRAWLQQHMPKEWAAVCAYRINLRIHMFPELSPELE